MENEQHEEVIYDASLEKTLDDISMSGTFFKVLQNPAGDRSWNGIVLKILRGTRVKLGHKD